MSIEEINESRKSDSIKISKGEMKSPQMQDSRRQNPAIANRLSEQAISEERGMKIGDILEINSVSKFQPEPKEPPLVVQKKQELENSPGYQNQKRAEQVSLDNPRQGALDSRKSQYSAFGPPTSPKELKDIKQAAARNKTKQTNLEVRHAHQEQTRARNNEAAVRLVKEQIQEEIRSNVEASDTKRSNSNDNTDSQPESGYRSALDLMA